MKEKLLSAIRNARYGLFLSVFAGWMTFAAVRRLAGTAGTEKNPGALLSGVLVALLLCIAAFTLHGKNRHFPAAAMLWCSALILCCTGLYGNRDLYAFLASFTLIAVVTVACFQAFREISCKDLPKACAILLISLAAAAFAIYLGAVTTARYTAYRNSAYDFGIFVQGYYSMLSRGIPYTTLERGYELSHFAVHLSPALWLGLPLFALFPYPETVQVLQALVLASSVLPLWLLCRRLRLSRRSSVFFCGLLLLYPAMVGGAMYDFHENCFLVPLLLWAIYFAERGNALPTLLFSLLACSVKEDSAVYVAFLGLFLLFSGRRKKIGASVLLFSIGYFLFACWYINTHGLGIMSWRYNNISDDGSLFGVILTAIRDPFRIFSECVEQDKLLFLVLMLLPLCGLPFATKKISRYILFGGLVLVNLMPDYVYQHSVDFQYVYGTLALLFYLSVLNFSELPDGGRRMLGTLACAATLLSASARMPDQLRQLSAPSDYAADIAVLDEALSFVPDGASVSCSTFLSPHLADREECYLIELMKQTDYAVVDLRYGEWDSYPDKYRKIGYTTVYRADGIVEVLQRPVEAE